jgi:hypothetical protein
VPSASTGSSPTGAAFASTVIVSGPRTADPSALNVAEQHQDEPNGTESPEQALTPLRDQLKIISISMIMALSWADPAA